MASRKRTDLFTELQKECNTGIIEGKLWKLVLDRGIRQNSTYLIIRQALELQEAIDTYAVKLHMSKEDFDQETFQQDYLTDEEQDTLTLIKDQLKPLFWLTKDLEGNLDLKDRSYKALHGSLQEVLLIFEFILRHFKALEVDAKIGLFHGHEGIQESITLTQGQAKNYYEKTDESVAQMAALVLHPRQKQVYFEREWTGSFARFVKSGKAKLKKLQEEDYKSDLLLNREKSPELAEKPSFLESILNVKAPANHTKVTRPTQRRDQLVLYLEEAPNITPVIEYWKSREEQWPQLTAMAYDFLAIPAMSSECERVFSSYAKQTTPESSRLSGEMLWHQECLKNLQLRGAIQMERAQDAILLDFN